MMHELKDYRGIHVLPALSKSLEKVMKWQITAYLNENDLLYRFQSGYRPKYSTTTALLKMTHDIRSNLHKRVVGKKFISFLLLLDFSSAFDLVNHDLLLDKLRTNFFFDDSAIKLLKSYLTDRYQTVLIDGYMSDYMRVRNGVPQGSVLGPLLFSMFINDLPEVVKYCIYHLFADDVQLYYHHDWYDLSGGVKLVNKDLIEIQRWAQVNRFILNTNKSKAMIISETEINVLDNTLVENPIVLNSEQIKYVKTVKSLGLLLNNTLTWSDQVKKMKQKIYGGLRCLWTCCSYLSYDKRSMLVKTLLLPYFTYCDQVMCDMDAEAENSLQVAMNACIRFVFKMKRRDHISTQESSILGCSYPNYKKFRLCQFIRNILITGQPDYLAELISWTHSNRNPSLIVPFSTRAILKNSFFIRAASLWNSLPLDIKRKVSSPSFNNDCMLYFSQIDNA